MVHAVSVSWMSDGDAVSSRAIAGKAGRYMSMDRGANADRLPSTTASPAVFALVTIGEDTSPGWGNVPGHDGRHADAVRPRGRRAGDLPAGHRHRQRHLRDGRAELGRLRRRSPARAPLRRAGRGPGAGLGRLLADVQ